MQATQPIPLRTFSPPKLGLAAVLALTAAIAGGIFVTQLAWAPGASDATTSAADIEAALTQVRAGEREELRLGNPGASFTHGDTVTGHGYSGYR